MPSYPGQFLLCTMAPLQNHQFSSAGRASPKDARVWRMTFFLQLWNLRFKRRWLLTSGVWLHLCKPSLAKGSVGPVPQRASKPSSGGGQLVCFKESSFDSHGSSEVPVFAAPSYDLHLFWVSGPKHKLGVEQAGPYIQR